MIKLTKAIAKALSQCDSNGAKNLVYQLAEMYKTADQDTKDAIVLYFLDFRECYADGTIDGCDDAEREAINFINECLVNEEGESLFSL
jgi:hypothetical protein